MRRRIAIFARHASTAAITAIGAFPRATAVVFADPTRVSAENALYDLEFFQDLMLSLIADISWVSSTAHRRDRSTYHTRYHCASDGEAQGLQQRSAPGPRLRTEGADRSRF